MAGPTRLNAHRTLHKTVQIDGLDIFYRVAGPKDAPTILLLHGFPTSSHMFRNLIPALADEYHLVAPDYPGYGNSSMPTMDKFHYTFGSDHGAAEQRASRVWSRGKAWRPTCFDSMILFKGGERRAIDAAT